MNRRTLLKNLAVATSAALLLPSCIGDPKKVSIALNNLNITPDDEALLAALADTIIPKTGKPGATDVAAHHYTLVMIDDCADQLTKDMFLKGVRSFDQSIKQLFGTRFSKADQGERVDILNDIERSKVDNEQVTGFYHIVKKYVIEGYTNSQYYLTEVRPYELVPGPNFKGCVPLSETKTLS